MQIQRNQHDSPLTRNPSLHVAFLWALRKLGASRGQKLTRLRRVKAIASTRKFDRHGDWHYFTKVIPASIPALFVPSARTALARRYWYTDDR